MAQLVKNPPAMRETGVRSLRWEDPLEKGMATHSSILACSPQGRRELDMAERLSLHFSFPFKAINPHPPVCLLVWGVGAHQLFFLLSLFPLRGRSGFVVKSPPACVGGSGDVGLIHALGRSPGEGNGYPLQYSGRGNSMDCIVDAVAELEMTE